MRRMKMNWTLVSENAELQRASEMVSNSSTSRTRPRRVWHMVDAKRFGRLLDAEEVRLRLRS